MAISKISLDLRARSFQIEVPDERVDAVLSKLEGLLRLPVPADTLPLDNGQPKSSQNILTEEQTATVPDGNGVANTVKKRRGQGKGGAKVRSYELVDLGLNDEQRAAIRDFYAKMSPVQQNDSVATLVVKMKEFLGKSEFTADEIHSAFKIVDKPTPKNLIAVFGNMKRDGRASYSNNKIIAIPIPRIM